ncbi:hypothetical protein H696_04278 [Fonticula alba]|uniref:Acetyl-CoA C-acetyltransferase n=1 Tax=Fonticula alba TaxID=691883 RepID=A0A058Z3L9_FONAL|nr:hypothetical protein H696_04278 [Fonticula alba]KCV68860.1 hypothetical protein H696_04278 [Fonticula alba]|eukprot:XP_009496431.1 hypothetical protein H696_04278 [Fonticula alba]
MVTPTSSQMELDDVFIVGYARTPIGSIGGQLASVTATDLAGHAITAALKRSNVPASAVQELVMGHVISAGCGQSPPKQAAVAAGLPDSVICTSVNKVCSSGMKAVHFAYQSIVMGYSDVAIAAGTESLSQAPFLMPKNVRNAGFRYGSQTLTDSIQNDGLTDSFGQALMGDLSEQIAHKMSISRQEQDAHAIETYRRAIAARDAGAFDREIVPVTVPGVRGRPDVVVTSDEELSRAASPEKIRSLRTVFTPPTGAQPTITAATSSGMNDGAAALVLASGAWLRATRARLVAEGAPETSLPAALARVVSCADAEQDPALFSISPNLAVRTAVARAKLSLEDIGVFEINEAFSVVALANLRLLGLDDQKVNIYGGAVALGHPLGCSGARIVVTLLNALAHGPLDAPEGKGASRYGCAAICNGGGGASACIVERVNPDGSPVATDSC